MPPRNPLRLLRTALFRARRAALVLALLAAPAVADIYKWKDAQGRTHISDTPPPQGTAERLQIRTFAGPAEVAPADRRSPAEPSRSESAPAVQNIVMLSTTWCGVCKRARAWLTQKGIPFTEHDVERSPTGQAEYRRLRGRGVPIILVGDQRMDGFSPARLETMLKNAK